MRPTSAERGCVVDGCTAPHNAQGYCRRHYAGARSAGLIHKLTDEGRFWSYVDKADGCWLWVGPTTNGYPQFGMNGVQVRAHRHSWEMVNGPMANDLFACHTCDTPLCVNPDHIYAGTPADNVRDMVVRGRANNGKSGQTHCKRDHPLSGENLKVTSEGKRACRACRAMLDTKYRRRRQAARGEAA
jgi:hypothetical protein